MASDLNRVTLVGRLTRDPELKSTSSGQYLCRFTLASNRFVYRREGENSEEAGFFDCVAWAKKAEIISKYATKGMRIGVDGSLRFSSWENSEGKRQSKVEINVDDFQFLDSRQGSSGYDNQSSQSSMSSPGPEGYQPAPDESVYENQDSKPGFDDDLPF